MRREKIIGSSVPQVGSREKVTGSAVYAVDVTLPHMLWGKVLRSPIAYGRIKRIDISKALTIPGVKTVLTGWMSPASGSGARSTTCPYWQTA